MSDDDVNRSDGGDAETAPAIVTDLAWGFAGTVTVVAVCLLLGGFSFFAPWLILVPAVMFAAGLIRGRSAGRIAAKGIALSAFLLMLLILATLHSALSLLAGIPIIVAPAIAGVAARRWRIKVKRLRA